MGQVRRLPGCRCWPFFVIDIPVNAEGQGPVSVSDAVKIIYEVWDRNHDTKGQFENLNDAIDLAVEMSSNFYERNP